MTVATILHRGRAHPDQVAIRCGKAVWTYGRLMEEVTSYRRELIARSCPQELLAISVDHSAASAACLLAAAADGQPMVLLPATLPAPEADSLWLESRATSRVHPGVIPSDDRWQRTRAIGAPFPPVGAGAICQVTSGSSGASRLAVRSAFGIDQELAALGNRLTLSRHDRVLCTSSIAHSYGLFGGLLAPLAAGAEVTLASGGTDLIGAAAEARPTVVIGLPGTYATLLEGQGGDALAAVRYCLSAGAPLPAGLFDSFKQRQGLQICQDYGTTETGTIAVDTSESPGSGAVGRPLPHLEFRLVAPRSIPLPAGTSGEIQVRGRGVADAYIQLGELRPCADPEGWYHTGDAGSLIDGCIHLGPRLRETLAVPGRSVRPEVLENAIRHLPGVRDAVAIVAIDDTGAAIVKLVIAASVVAEDRARSWCAANLLPEVVPDVVKVVEELPRSAAGKILEKYLR